MEGNAPKDVFNIIEIKEGKAKWLKIGSAYTNRDGSINAFLDAYPRDGKLQIRDRKPKESNNTKGE